MKLSLSMVIAIVLTCACIKVCNAQSTDTTIIVKVKGISCSSDHNLIKSSVEKIDGVTEFKVKKEGATSSYEIIYDPKKAKKEQLIRAIEGTGSCGNPEEKPYTVKK